MKKPQSESRAVFTDADLEDLHLRRDFKWTSLSDDEWVRLKKINLRRESERLEIIQSLRTEQVPILEELKKSGIDVNAIGQINNKHARYKEALSILLKHLQMPYSDGTRAVIASAMSYKEAQIAWPVLVAEYKRAPSGKGVVAPGVAAVLGLQTKDRLANALATAVTSETLDELIDLVSDKSNGESRILLLDALRKRRGKNEKVKIALEYLIKDQELAKEISSWKLLNK